MEPSVDDCVHDEELEAGARLARLGPAEARLKAALAEQRKDVQASHARAQAALVDLEGARRQATRAEASWSEAEAVGASSLHPPPIRALYCGCLYPIVGRLCQYLSATVPQPHSPAKLPAAPQQFLLLILLPWMLSRTQMRARRQRQQRRRGPRSLSASWKRWSGSCMTSRRRRRS